MNMKLQRKYFDLINMGIKKYEVRLLDENVQNYELEIPYNLHI